MSAAEELIVIGASAGGLEALDLVFEGVATDPRVAYVVILHLSPNHESTLPARIRKRTSMEVVATEERGSRLPIEGGVIYVAGPGSALRFEDEELVVERLEEGTRELRSIDAALDSAAHAWGSHATGVILSGTASDGARGVCVIREHGGTVAAQLPKSAAFASMPEAAIATGAVDLVVPPSRLLSELASLRRLGPTEYFQLLEDDSMGVLPHLLTALEKQTGKRFDYYKPATVVRRTRRRMAALELKDPRAYVDRLRDDSDEANRLQRSLLIGVTSFSRDRDAVERLLEVGIPHLLDEFPDERLRLWVAGCSTGQEAYTVAMLFHRAIEERGIRPQFRLFATDVDSGAIAQATRGEFDEDEAASLPRDLRDRYLNPRSGKLVVTRDLRDHLLFSEHDVVVDPPYSRLHFVSCRNLLIYLTPQYQDRVLRTFSNSLRDGGVLWLGPSESLSVVEKQFDALDNRWRIFQARPGRRRNSVEPLGSRLPSPPASDTARRAKEHAQSLLSAVTGALGGYAPPTLLVSQDYQLIYRFGELERILQVPLGEPSLDVRELLPRELSGVVRAAFDRLRRGEDADIVFRGLVLSRDGGDEGFDLRVRQLIQRPNEPPVFALTFENLSRGAEEPVPLTHEDLKSDLGTQLTETRAELAEVRANLQTTVEELESSNEELQSTNEELIASNEELQSVNEELQSVNEELHTVNAEHHEKVLQLTELNAELDEILEATSSGLVVLDNEMRLARFNLAARDYINLLDADLGRPLAHLTHQLAMDDLLSMVAGVISSGSRASRRVSAGRERTVLVDVHPRERGSVIYGALITITDVSVIVAAEGTERQLNAVLELSGLSVAVVNPDGTVVGFNSAYARATGRDPDHLHQTSVHDLLSTQDAETFEAAFRACTAGERWSGILQGVLPDGSLHWELVDLVPGPTRGRGGATVLRIAQPLTRLLPRGIAQPHPEERREYWLWDPASDRAYFTSGLPDLWGVDQANVSMAALSEVLEPEARDEMLAAIERALGAKEVVTVSVPIRRPEGDAQLRTRMQRRRQLGGGWQLIGQTQLVEE